MDALTAEVVEGMKQLDPARQQLVLEDLARLLAEQRAEG